MYAEIVHIEHKFYNRPDGVQLCFWEIALSGPLTNIVVVFVNLSGDMILWLCLE